MTKRSILDKLVLFRHEVVRVHEVSKTLRVFHTSSEETPIILKFSYAGNIQYHKLNGSEANALVSELSGGLNSAYERAGGNSD